MMQMRNAHNQHTVDMSLRQAMNAEEREPNTEPYGHYKDNLVLVQLTLLLPQIVSKTDLTEQ